MDSRKALNVSVAAARSVGALMKKNISSTKKVNSSTQYDIKLELDVRCQELITRALRRAFPAAALLGEEGVAGDPGSEYRWVVDPIDGTVNFTYGIPHACVSIALQKRLKKADYPNGFQTVTGVVLDPFCNELFTAIRGERSRLNGRPIRVSRVRDLREAIVSIGFAKSKASLESTLPYFNKLIRRVRKIRMLGAAALGLCYVATGRFDAYVERGIRLWDIAAGGLIIECAGGEFWHRPIRGAHAYQMVASNGLLRRTLRVPIWDGNWE